MRSICLYFRVHQPVRLKRFRFFDIGNSGYYYDDFQNEYLVHQVAQNCYLPANKILLKLINKYQGKFKLAFSISGTALDQFQAYAPEVIDSFRELAFTGCVEFVAEPYASSLSALHDKEEFRKQVRIHVAANESLFGARPAVFANTGLVYSDEIGALAAELGFRGILAEGPRHALEWRSPNYLYNNAVAPSLAVLLKNDRLSDDVAFRFSDPNWSEWPLDPKKFVSWLNMLPQNEKMVNLFMDYETFGERQKHEDGIFDFLSSMPGAVLRGSKFQFMTPTELLCLYQPTATLHVGHQTVHASAQKWLGNELQQEAFEKLYQLSGMVRDCHDKQLLKDWQYLQTSDHFFYMNTNHDSGGGFQASHSPYGSPFEAFINYMNVLNDFAIRLERYTQEEQQQYTQLKKKILETA
ncbi:glycoside hydrolase family 57 protein [Gaoshiqia sediminis]|uniref:Glycoside hydrolase family 57 protein n=1 Tax=Gaoshiqia sediminis TaxID=2986998 RepID=A0AA41Y8W1_9BACT|nr:glycoside hydrolase family 57 protein [Gaoshiqia sediminis]MCW0483352.1 glycoside hydrolase family 57 protein [Gaoshiqia sediminis]